MVNDNTVLPLHVTSIWGLRKILKGIIKITFGRVLGQKRYWSEGL